MRIETLQSLADQRSAIDFDSDTAANMQRYPGLLITHHTVRDRASKAEADSRLFDWEYTHLPADEWMQKLSHGNIIILGEFDPKPDGSYTHAERYWKNTYFVFGDADHIRGVEYDEDGIDVNPNGVDPWTEKGQLSRKCPRLLEEVYAVGESVNSMLKEPLHRRYRLAFQFDQPITCSLHYRQIHETLHKRYPIISTDKRQPAQPVYGNAREGYNSVYINGKTLKLSDFPYIEPSPVTASKPKAEPKTTNDEQHSSLQKFLDKHNVPYTLDENPDARFPNRFFVLCPETSKHTNKTSEKHSFVWDDGNGFAFHCSHKSCLPHTWEKFKAGYNIVVQDYTPSEKPKQKSKPSAIQEAKQASDFFIDSKTFNILAMSEFVQEKYTIWAQDSGIYIYNEKTGLYEPGELDIDQTIRTELGELRKKSHVDEVLADIRVCCRRNVPDNSNLIAFQNGVFRLNLDTDRADDPIVEFTEHSPDNYLMSVFPVKFEIEPEHTAGAQDFEKWLLDTVSNDGGLFYVIYEVIGSIFHQDSPKMQKGVLFIGEGGTGKSMLLSLIARMIGKENICATAWQDFGKDSFAFGDLYDKALALDADIDVDRPLSGAIKPAITGNEIRCNRKYQQPFDFNPTATWIGSINRFPKTRDKTWGFFRRWLTIPFNKSYPTNAKFESEKKKLWSDPATMTRIVHDAITCYVEAYRGNGAFTIPKTAAELAREMHKAANTVISWIDENCVPADNGVCTRAEAYQAYTEYCIQHNFDPETSRGFLATLRTQGYNVDGKLTIDGKQKRVIQGLMILH